MEKEITEADIQYVQELAEIVNADYYGARDQAEAIINKVEQYKFFRSPGNGGEESIECPHCNGDGYTSEHANHPHEHGDCAGQCPIQSPCGYCYADGRITTKLMKTHIEENRKSISEISDKDLPF